MNQDHEERIDALEKIALTLLGTNDKLMDHITKYIENVDAWVKQINARVATLEGLPAQNDENIDNIQHNYELIYELKDQIEELKQELNALKLIQIISLKQKKAEVENGNSKQL